MDRLALHKDRVLWWLFVSSVVASGTLLFLWVVSGVWALSLSLYLLSPQGKSELMFHDGSNIFLSIDSTTIRSTEIGFEAVAADTFDPLSLASLEQQRQGSFLGFYSLGVPYEYAIEIIPLWAPLLALGLYQAWWRTHCYGRFVRRTKPGTCVDCGYDLRGLTERCPECGRPIGRVEALPPSAVARTGGRAIRLDRRAKPRDASAAASSLPP